MSVGDEYFAVTQKVQALYDTQMPAQAEGTQMWSFRYRMHRMLGNGYCERPTQIGCNFECICESCSFLTTGLQFRLTLQLQHDDAVHPARIPDQRSTKAPSTRSTGTPLDTDHPHNYNPKRMHSTLGYRIPTRVLNHYRGAPAAA